MSEKRPCYVCSKRPTQVRYGDVFCSQKCALAWALQMAPELHPFCEIHKAWATGYDCLACNEAGQ
jgi:hypothetical protein